MKIKACPFCGGKPYIEESQRGFINGQSTKVCFIRCKWCNARSPRVDLADYGCTSYSSEAIKDVVEAWNKRAETIKEYDIIERGRERGMDSSRTGIA